MTAGRSGGGIIVVDKEFDRGTRVVSCCMNQPVRQRLVQL